LESTVIKYSIWSIEDKRAVATISNEHGQNVQSQVVEIPLADISQIGGPIFEGWWPKNGKPRRVALGGVCLWDARWLIKFKKRGKGNEGARRTLALPYERKDAFERLSKGHQIEKIFYPLRPSEYHSLLIRWQGQKLKEFHPEKILFHVPIKEYHCFIARLEELIGNSLEELHSELDVFTDDIKNMISNNLGGLMEVVDFIDPMSCGAMEPEESFLWPYLHPEKFGFSADDIYGIEDLAELKLALHALKARGHCIPVICCVPTIPDAYAQKTDKETNVILF